MNLKPDHVKEVCWVCTNNYFSLSTCSVLLGQLQNIVVSKSAWKSDEWWTRCERKCKLHVDDMKDKSVSTYGTLLIQCTL